MATYSNLGIKLIQTGEESGTWGTTTNTNFDLIDQAIAGYVSHAMSCLLYTSPSPRDA